MIKILAWVREFWKLPVERQLASLLFVAASVIYGMYIDERRSHNADEKANQFQRDSASRVIQNVIRECEQQKERIRRENDSSRFAGWYEQKEEMKAEIRESRKDAQDALQELKKVISNRK